jgi:hypothetical protein
MPIFRRKAILGAILFLEKNRWQEKPHARGKATCRRKSNMKEEKKHGEKEGNPSHDRVRVFDKDCNGYKPVK